MPTDEPSPRELGTMQYKNISQMLTLHPVGNLYLRIPIRILKFGTSQTSPRNFSPFLRPGKTGGVPPLLYQSSVQLHKVTGEHIPRELGVMQYNNIPQMLPLHPMGNLYLRTVSPDIWDIPNVSSKLLTISGIGKNMGVQPWQL